MTIEVTSLAESRILATYTHRALAEKRAWKRFFGLLSWREVTYTSSMWWAAVGPGHFVAIQAFAGTSGESLFILCLALDGQTSFHGVFCDPSQCTAVSARYVEPVWDYDLASAAAAHGARCPVAVRLRQIIA